MLAVIALFAMIAAMVVPGLDLGGSRDVRNAAADLAAAVEFARQRAVMTGRTHVVQVDVDASTHWVEWAAPREPQAAPAAAEGDERVLDLVPPPLELEELVPVAGEFGRPRSVERGVVIVGVELAEGIAETGGVGIRIEGDGYSDAAAILVATEDGDYPLRVEIEPLADVVQVVHAE
jgi:type II secretory pathway pseudopilin PulG